MDNETKEMFNALFNVIKDIQADVKNTQSDIKSMEADIEGMKSDIGDLKFKVDKNSNDINGLRATLETETNHYIKVIAEGHEMQMTKVNNYIHAVEDVRAKQEIIEIRLSMLEQKVKDLKRA